MKCIALLDSGNHAFLIAAELKNRGIGVEVIPAPCSIAVSGCGFCIKFPVGHLDAVVKEAERHDIPLRGIYETWQSGKRERYKILARD